ncbi:MAG: hypothetical protein ACI8SR_000959 [Oceanicoccus sp.]|jgi:hypothetical protein
MYFYIKGRISTRFIVWMAILVGSSMNISNSFAGTTVALRESYAGNLSFALTGGSFRTTSNSQNACTRGTTSSNPLSTIPLSAKIKKAYLYWAASSSNSTYTDNYVTLNNQGITADRTYTDSSGSSYYYGATSDITNIIKASRNTTYTVGNLDIYASTSRCSTQTVLGGWSILVIYEDDAEDFSVLNVYEGFQYFQRDAAISSLTLTPSNFKLPTNPKGQHAHITWEGDDTIGNDGEGLTFEGNDLYDSINGNNALGNQFDSYSNIEGGLTTYGVDIDSYDVSAYLNEGATSVSTTYTARQDGVLLTAEIINVSNIPVADLAVSTSNSTGWMQGSTVTKKFTISNNGPNDVPTQSVRFTTTLPSQLSFNGTQGDSDWLCTQIGQQLTCIYQPKLRSGWSDYLDLKLDVAAGTAGQTASWSVTVGHDTAPYDIFDNHAENDRYTLSVPIGATPVVDLSASSKTPNNLNGDLLLAGDTLQYVITIDDASDLATSGIRLYDDLPANISGYTITSLPTNAVSNSTTSGGANGTGYLDIQNINLAAGAVEQVVLEVYVNSNAPEGASLQNTATLSYNSNNWVVDTGDITVVEPDLTASTKAASDDNGGLLLPGESITYTITLNETNNLELPGIQVLDHLPANISSFTVSQLPSGVQDFSQTNGGNNGTGLIDIRNINLAAGATAIIEIKAIIADDAADQVSVQNTANLVLNSSSWDVESNQLYVTLSNSTPASGNKPLYLVNNNLTRNLPSTDTSRSFFHGDTLIWSITPVLQKDLVISSGNSRFNLAVEGHRTGRIQTQFTAQLYYNDNNGSGNVSIDTATIGYGNYRINTLYNLSTDFNLASDITVPAGSTVYLSILNTSSNNISNQYSEIDVHTLNGNFYSAVNLNTSTVINVDGIQVWDQTYGDPTGTGEGLVLPNTFADTTIYIRANISDPFGAFDISKATIEVQKKDGSYYDFSGLPNTNEMTQVDTIIDDTTTSVKVYEIPVTLLEENESTGWWQIAITGYEGLEVAPNQITHERTTSFYIKPFLPSIALNKTIEVISDPINGLQSAGNKPKAIPGAELQYTIHAINSGRGASDSNSITLQDEIAANAELYIGDITCLNRGPGSGNGPICFEDGANPNESQLSFDFLGLGAANDSIYFSQDGADFSYEPVDSGDSYDPTVRYIRMKPSGIYKQAKKDGSETPEFNFSYQIRLQ